MTSFLKRTLVYLATNKKARAAEWTLAVVIFEAIRSSLGHP